MRSLASYEIPFAYICSLPPPPPSPFPPGSAHGIFPRLVIIFRERLSARTIHHCRDRIIGPAGSFFFFLFSMIPRLMESRESTLSRLIRSSFWFAIEKLKRRMIRTSNKRVNLCLLILAHSNINDEKYSELVGLNWICWHFRISLDRSTIPYSTRSLYSFSLQRQEILFPRNVLYY